MRIKVDEKQLNVMNEVYGGIIFVLFGIFYYLDFKSENRETPPDRRQSGKEIPRLTDVSRAGK